MKLITLIVCSFLFVRASVSLELKHVQIKADLDAARDRRDVIEEEKFYNIRSEAAKTQPTPWVPGRLKNDDPTTKISISNEVKDVLPLYQTTEKVTDKPTGRGARASNENWIKLPFSARDDEALTPPKSNGDLINSRMPRVDFVTQNKGLDAQESRNDKESIHRARHEEIRTEFVRPEETARKSNKPIYPRQAIYYPEEPRRYFYDDRYYPDMYYRREPARDYLYDRRRQFPGARLDNRYDDDHAARKPKRIIYYAHLPDVVRPPPSYKYPEPYRRFDEDYGRAGRFDYRFRNRTPYAPYRRDDRFNSVQRYRDLALAGTVNKEKKIEEKVTAAPVLPSKEDKYKSKDSINTDSYDDDGINILYNEGMSHKAFPDVLRTDDPYIRYDEPLFHSAIIDDPYRPMY